MAGTPQWPLSQDAGKPMWFIAQFQVPPGLAYFFMTDATDYVDYAAAPDGGENAVIIQRGGRLRLLQRSIREEHRPVPLTTAATGPSIAPEDHVLVPSPAPGQHPVHRRRTALVAGPPTCRRRAAVS